MAAKKCPVCGEKALKEKRGEYRMEMPPNVSGGPVVVADASWQHCGSCGEDILSLELEKAINRQCRGKRVSRVS